MSFDTWYCRLQYNRTPYLLLQVIMFMRSYVNF